ncbi:MAG: type II secretion system protein [Terracidiphilus sp.]
MMLRVAANCRRRPSEEGYILVAVIFMLAILILSLAVALPRVREDIQRDREVETMHRGKQYVRAIQLYYRKFGSYPPSVDALVKTNNIRFLRKQYIDPTTGKDDWKPILYGQNKTPLAMGFFGQPLAGTALAGIGPSGGNGLTGTTGTTGGFGNSNNGSSGSGSSGFTLGGSGTAAGTDTGSGTAGTAGGAGTPGTPSGTDASGTATAGSGLGTSPGGQTFGGAGIIGFSPASPKQSILVYKKKNHYNEWEFLYSPLSDQKANATGITGGTGLGSGGIGGAGGVSNPVTNTPLTPTVPTAPTDPTAPTSTTPPQ